jgi:hypothetical protein
MYHLKIRKFHSLQQKILVRLDQYIQYKNHNHSIVNAFKETILDKSAVEFEPAVQDELLALMLSNKLNSEILDFEKDIQTIFQWRKLY